MANRDPMHPDMPVKLPVPIRECVACKGKFVPVSDRGTGKTHCPACRKKITEMAREKSLEVRRAAKTEREKPAFTTTIDWYRPTERLPERSQEVLYISNSGACLGSVQYSSLYNAFNATDNRKPDNALQVSFWAYLPANLQEMMEAAWEEFLEKKKEDE